jgi:hypothetical protein
MSPRCYTAGARAHLPAVLGPQLVKGRNFHLLLDCRGNAPTDYAKLFFWSFVMIDQLQHCS